jgi:hypothetical protein
MIGTVMSIPVVALGNGDTEGIPGQKPLNFISIALVDGGKVEGRTTIPLKPKFKITFDKNVVNITVWENNRKCFHIYNENGEDIPIYVIKIDDTVDFNQRQHVFIEPIKNLRPGTWHSLRISPKLLAKNGNSTLGGTTGGKEKVITFKTEGMAIQEKVVSKTPPANSETMTNQNSHRIENSKKEIAQPLQKKETGKTDSNQNLKNEKQEVLQIEKNNEKKQLQETQSPPKIVEEGNDIQKKSSESIKKDEVPLVKTNRKATETKEASIKWLFSRNGWLSILAVVLCIGWFSIERYFKKRK